MALKCDNCGKRFEAESARLVDLLVERCKFCRGFRNLAMARALAKGGAIDVARRPRDGDGSYELDHYYDGKDYADSVREEWIFSIGLELAPPHRILAATDTRFYGHPGFRCLWLR
jgi:hypothetical protein